MPADGFDAAAKDKSGPRHVPLAAPKAMDGQYTGSEGAGSDQPKQPPNSIRCWHETVMPVLSPRVRCEGMNGPSSVAVQGPVLTHMRHCVCRGAHCPRPLRSAGSQFPSTWRHYALRVTTSTAPAAVGRQSTSWQDPLPVCSLGRPCRAPYRVRQARTLTSRCWGRA
jgi:hypothetical protein